MGNAYHQLCHKPNSPVHMRLRSIRVHPSSLIHLLRGRRRDFQGR